LYSLMETFCLLICLNVSLCHLCSEMKCTLQLSFLNQEHREVL
jgi:hypothetical protein